MIKITRSFRHYERLEKQKIVFQFTLTLLSALLIGAILTKAYPSEFLSFAEARISSHFEKLFLNVSAFDDILSLILRYSLDDIVAILIVFAVSFFMFNYTATDIVLVFCGIKYGFTAALLSKFISGQELSYILGFPRYLVFVTLKFAILALIFCYSCKAASCSISMRQKNAIGRFTLSTEKLFYLIAITLVYIGSAITVNGVYCWLIYILK